MNRLRILILASPLAILPILALAGDKNDVYRWKNEVKFDPEKEKQRLREHRVGTHEAHEMGRLHRLRQLWEEGRPHRRHGKDDPHLSILAKSIKRVKEKDGTTRYTGIIENKTGKELPLLLVVFEQPQSHAVFPTFLVAQTTNVPIGGRWEFKTPPIDPGILAAQCIAVRALDDSVHPIVDYPWSMD